MKQLMTALIAALALRALAVNPGELARTQVTNENIDDAACAVWTDGAETKEGLPNPHQILWRRNGNNNSPYGENFGKSDAKTLTQHLRYAFKEAIPVGSILSMSNERVSVLKPTAKYPGDMNDDSQWIPGEHLLKNGKLSKDPKSGFIVWVFPEGTKTRAVRYTHTAQPLDADKRGWINTILLMPERKLSLGRFAKAYSNQYAKRADLLNDGQDNGLGGCWSNVDGSKKDPPKVGKENPGVFWLSWPEAVDIDNLVFLHCGCSACEVDVYSGPKDREPGAAKASDWKFVKAFSGFEFNFPWTFPNILTFDKTLHTRAIRVRITGTENCGHPHVAGYNQNGTRVVLGEVLVLGTIGKTEKHAPPEFVAKLNREILPPIPVRFNLPKDGYVSLVLENKEGKRLCNLVSDTFYKAGENTFWWDGSDDLGRDLDAANHGLYRIPDQPVAPGEYVVRGLYHDKIVPRYEFSSYISGRWVAGDNGSDWLANHGNPQAAAYCPGEGLPDGEPLVFFGALVTEGPHGLIWVDRKGVKRGGMTWVGGNWLAAPYLCSDLGPEADPKNAVYTAAVFETDGDNKQREVRINALRKENLHHVHQVVRLPIIRDYNGEPSELLQGTAVRNRKMALALNRQDAIWILSTDNGAVERKIEGVVKPKGIAYDHDGTLWAIADGKVVKIVGNKPMTVIGSGLVDPRGLTIDAKGQLYVSEGGDSNQIKVFTRQGRLVRTVGKRGRIASGPYDAKQMRSPHGMAVDGEGRLWVAENFNIPKRCSLWSEKGELLKTWFGAPKYGDGGTIDGHNPRKWYYSEGNGMMEFYLDWTNGVSKLVNILALDGDFGFHPPGGYGGWGNYPERATYHDGRRYLNNSYNNNPVSAPATMSMYTDCGGGRMRPCVAMGDVNNWRNVLETDEFRPRWPDRERLHGGFFIWCDLNNDGKVNPNEVSIDPHGGGSPIVQDDMSVTILQDNKAKRLKPQWKKGCEAPLYKLDSAEVLCEEIKWSPSDGGNYVMADDSGFFAMANSAAPYSAHSFAGGKMGKGATWSIPSLWPGLHASHSAPTPKKPGELIGTVRVMGPLMKPKGSQIDPIWLMSGNTGIVYAFTRDGILVTRVFGDERQSRGFGIPADERGTKMTDETIHGENFWTTATCTDTGVVLMTCRARILRLNGFGSMRPIAPFRLTVTKADLAKVRAYRAEVEAQRRAREGSGVIPAPVMPAQAIAIDGKFDDWKDVTRVNIEQQGAYAFFDSGSHPFDLKGGIAVSGDRLCAVWSTGNRDLINNNNENPTAPFKTGGCLDVMLGLNPSAPSRRAAPAPGDIRFLVTKVDGKTKALVYRQKVANPNASRAVVFKSPVREVTFDQIDDVSAQVQLAQDDQGNYEVSVPLSALGFKAAPRAGTRIKADIGVLRAENGHVNARHYWANKATAITADLPSEAELMPGFWGELEFQ